MISIITPTYNSGAYLEKCIQSTLQKIIDYLEQHNISEETFMISTGLSKSSLIKAKGSLSADDYLTICSTLGVSPWFFYERELTEGSSDS